jgi:hypothetical protein
MRGGPYVFFSYFRSFFILFLLEDKTKTNKQFLGGEHKARVMVSIYQVHMCIGRKVVAGLEVLEGGSSGSSSSWK